MPSKTPRKTKTVMMLPTELVEDFSLYPRESVDSTHVRHIAEAIRAGVNMPPPVADMDSKRITDGLHRRRAHIRVDKTAKIAVRLVDYPTEAEMFADAMRLNANHGHNLSANDRTRCILLAREFGIDDEETSVLLNIRRESLTRYIETRVTPVQSGGRPVVIKTSLLPAVKRLNGPLSDAQVRVNEQTGGMSQMFHVNSIIRWIESDLFDTDDEALMDRLRALVKVSRRILRK